MDERAQDFYPGKNAFLKENAQGQRGHLSERGNTSPETHHTVQPFQRLHQTGRIFDHLLATEGNRSSQHHFVGGKPD
jgi:hypothetical protein